MNVTSESNCVLRKGMIYKKVVLLVLAAVAPIKRNGASMKAEL